jgi:hypothetical protein
MSDRKAQSKKWWSKDAVEMLLPLHLTYTNDFLGSKQLGDYQRKQ